MITHTIALSTLNSKQDNDFSQAFIGRSSLQISQVAHHAEAYPSFHSIKHRTGVILLHPGWNASPLQVYLQH